MSHEMEKDTGSDILQLEDAGGHKAIVDLSAPGTHHHDDDEVRQKLGFHTWFAVFIASVSVFSQTFVLISAGSILAFIIRDVGNPGLAGWIIQAPLLMQVVLSPILGRLADVVSRKYVAGIPPLLAFAGAIISARATSINELIGGGILIGCMLSTAGVVGAIPAEVLPMKYRSLANGFNFFAGVLAGNSGGLAAGALASVSISAWRNIFYIEAGIFLVSGLLFLFFLKPLPVEYPKMTVKQIIWMLDPIGSLLLICGLTLLLLGLDWGGSSYPWNSAHVATTLALGCAGLVSFGLYEVFGRSDGMIPHTLQHNRNFCLSLFALAVEGIIFFSAVGQITPQVVLNLGFQTDAFLISVRQLSYGVPGIFAVWIIAGYATRFKDNKAPLIFCYTLFLAVCICYSRITPSDNHAQIGYNVMSGIGQAGPLTLLVALVQFAAPKAYLSTSTGLALSFRALGGSVGSAIITAITENKLLVYPEKVGAAATSAGLPASSVTALLTSFATGAGFDAIPGITPSILAAATTASRNVYAHAYQIAWASTIPWVVVAMVAVILTKSVAHQMTEHIESNMEVAHGKNNTSQVAA